MPQHVCFSPQLEKALQQLVPSDDPLDQQSFDPLDYVNKLFPTEEQLNNVDQIAQNLQTDLTKLDQEILDTVRQQTSNNISARKGIDTGRAAMNELFDKVRVIKTKADKSEQMVHEICRDIKSLDYAKRNLTITITALKRLQMLVTATDQLGVMARDRMYDEAAHLLLAVKELLAHFDAYTGVKKVEALREQVAETSASLRAQVFEDFNALSSSSSQEGAMPHSQAHALSGACAVVDALGPATRKETIAWFSNWQFAPYKHAFQPYGDAGFLEKTELRYSWHRKLLQQFENKFSSLFPTSWNVGLTITRDFCSITCAHLDEILDQSRGALDVQILTHALQKTVEFERDMEERFSSDAAAAAEDEEALHETEKDEDCSDHLAGVGISRSISSCFDSYMSIYVSLEDKSLGEAVSKLLSEETWSPEPSSRADSRVFTSSKELFIALKRSFKRGTALQMDAVLHELQRVWEKHLRQYAKTLQGVLDKGAASGGGSSTSLSTLEGTHLQTVCAVVNTAKYCAETSGQLEESLCKVMGDAWANRVDFSAVVDEHQVVVTAGMQNLVSALESRIAPSLTAMTKIKWESMEEVGEDTSGYMLEVVAKTREIMPMLGESLMPLYVRFFCDKFVQSFVPRLIGNMYRCKRIGDLGAQQMQIDLGTLKATLLELPALAQSSSTSIYTKLVNTEMANAEQLLKLVQMPESILEETVDEVRQSGVQVDFQKILELKGLKKADIRTELLNKIVSTAGAIPNVKLDKLYVS